MRVGVWLGGALLPVVVCFFAAPGVVFVVVFGVARGVVFVGFVVLAGFVKDLAVCAGLVRAAFRSVCASALAVEVWCASADLACPREPGSGAIAAAVLLPVRG